MEGVAGKSQWFERMESVFHISNCTVENQVKFATCTLHLVTLTWWNTHVKTVSHDAAYGMPWKTLMKMMTNKYCPRNEIKKLEMEIWDLKVKDSKRKFEDTLRNTHNQQQQQNKRQNTGRAYTTGSGEKKPYEGSKPLCGNFKRECPKLKNNNNRGNQVGGGNSPAKVYAIGHAGTNPDSNVVTDLIPVELGSFDAIIGMDWLVKYQAIIVCAEKIVSIPWGNETLIVHGDRSNRGHKARLHIISYTKIQEYMLKGCLVFLENVNTKETEDKSEKKRLEDVPIVWDFPNVFPEDLSAWAPYRLAPSEMKELSEQLKELSDKGFIRPSSSPWGAPVLFVKKKDR
ncbi:putative reverse transcriptase domain-containing protein [Tanacetum coccineum]